MYASGLLPESRDRGDPVLSWQRRRDGDETECQHNDLRVDTEVQDMLPEVGIITGTFTPKC